MKKRIIAIILIIAVGAAGFLTVYNMNKNISEEMAVNIANGLISELYNNEDLYISYISETVVDVFDANDGKCYKVYRWYDDGTFTLDGGFTVIIDKKTGEVVDWYMDG